jgi:glutamyl-tRNA synthetase
MRGRFAPSPTGAMHLGNARTALLAWLAARSAQGSVVLRIEDLDQARVVDGAEAALLDELRFLGLDWDEGPDVGGQHAPYRQSQRQVHYDAAIQQLLASDQAYLCACSRADIARAASAPHGEDGGPRYPGTCARLPAAEVQARAVAAGRNPSVRFRGDGTRLPFDDLVHGRCDPLGPPGIDDFVIRRADGTAAYHLAVVVDDAAMTVTDVVRGDDLLSSTPRQLALYAALGAPPPRHAHVPLVLSPGGERLAKRTRPVSIADLRQRGFSAARIVGALAASAGLVAAGQETSPADLQQEFRLQAVRSKPVNVDSATLQFSWET